MISKKFIKFWIIILIIAAVFGLSLLYFFHMTVRIDSDFRINHVSVTEETSGKVLSKNSTDFSHVAMYGRYEYEFTADNQNFKISVFKTNNYEHYTVDIKIKAIDSGIGMFVISVGINGMTEVSEEHKIGESNCIEISVEP